MVWYQVVTGSYDQLLLPKTPFRPFPRPPGTNQAHPSTPREPVGLPLARSSYQSLLPLPVVVYFFLDSVHFSTDNAKFWPIIASPFSRKKIKAIKLKLTHSCIHALNKMLSSAVSRRFLVQICAKSESNPKCLHKSLHQTNQKGAYLQRYQFCDKSAYSQQKPFCVFVKLQLGHVIIM